MDERAAAGAGARGVRSGCWRWGGREAQAAAARPAAGGAAAPVGLGDEERSAAALPSRDAELGGRCSGSGAGIPPLEGPLRRGRAAPAPG